MSEITFIAAIVGVLLFAVLLAFLFRKTEGRDARREDNAGKDGGGVLPVSDGRKHDSDADGSDGGGGD